VSANKLHSLSREIHQCERCPRLRTYCKKVAQTKRHAYRNENYWGKPVSGFGDPNARLVIVGLAPAAHGANRTGRMFTGDRSGEWLYRALYRSGFANQPHSIGLNDNLKLSGVYITAVVRCAPPGNKPLPSEIQACAPFLSAEFGTLKHAQVYLALGQIGLTGLWKQMIEMKKAGIKATRPKFAHGASFELQSGQTILSSYHPSQQNTFTGRLTEKMFDSIFSEVRRILTADR
jgi:uracil-DNA glycosylase family 4